MATGASAPRVSLTLPPVRAKSSRLQNVHNAKSSAKLRTDLDEEETAALEDFTRATTKGSQSDDVSLDSAIFRQLVFTVTGRPFSSVASAVTEGSSLHVDHVRVCSVPNVSKFQPTCPANRVSFLLVQTALGLFQVQEITSLFHRIMCVELIITYDGSLTFPRASPIPKSPQSFSVKPPNETSFFAATQHQSQSSLFALTV